ncbi:MAG: nitroreductase family protein [Bacteroidales bacterium]|jgi:nitroreductase|nr:nitroreductase family protein [Bacteroidales bacterium]
MDTKKLFNERRSVNFFDKDKKLDNELIKEIIDLAVLAPSAFNLQPWRIIVVKSDESKQKLFELANKQPKVLEASANLLIIGNMEGYDETNPVWDEMLTSVGGNKEMVDGAKGAAAFLYGSTEERKMKFAESNAGLLAMSVMIAAKELGIESHPMSGLDFDGIHTAFNLNKGESVVMNIAIGYKDESKQLYPRRPRRGFDDIAEII